MNQQLKIIKVLTQDTKNNIDACIKLQIYFYKEYYNEKALVRNNDFSIEKIMKAMNKLNIKYSYAIQENYFKVKMYNVTIHNKLQYARKKINNL